MQIATIRFLAIPLLFSLLLFEGGGVSVAIAGAEHDHSHESTGESVDTIWTCSMHPQIQLPESGQCPICFMDLIEIHKESNVDRQSLRQISFDERARKLARVEVQPVTRGNAETEIRMVGKVDYDETRVGTITSWVNGRIDKLFVDYTGSYVKRGQAMAKVYSPELFTAQAELIQAAAALKRTEQSQNDIIKKTAARTLEASREKLRLLGLSKGQLQAIEKKGKPGRYVTLTAPMSGIVIKKDVNEGMYVKTGSPIYTLADLDQVWIILAAYESDLQAISLGQQIHFSVESYPGTRFQGKVSYIDPLVDVKTRTVRVRLNVDNSEAKLKPGMFVRAMASSEPENNVDNQPLIIPVSAPLVTGKRALVYVQVPDKEGIYIGREIILGPRQGEFYQVKSGLEEGELVVTRGNFKIDSAIQLQARPSLMNPYQEKTNPTDTTEASLFISKLNLLNQVFAEVSKAVHEKRPADMSEMLTTFGNNLKAIKAENIDSEKRLSWQELSMLLSSDIILLDETENERETEQLYTTLAEHFHMVRREFSLNDIDAARLGSPLLREKITGLLTRYLDLQQHLATDNFEAAHADGIALGPLAKKVSDELEQTDLDQANALSGRLKSDIIKLVSAEQLSDVRTVFYPLSETIAKIVKTFGSAGKKPLYIQFCPMAFENKGATWLASSEEINNPYFGEMMLRCGEVRQQITY